MKLKDLSLAGFLKELEDELSKVDGIYSDMERYAICDTGKRVRPSLIYMVAKSFNQELDSKELIPSAMCIEYIHNYSLVHDDLPCMDNDEYRRGKYTVHKMFGEANAVLLGDKLLTNAFKVSQNIKYKSVQKLMVDAASLMLEGQYVDVNRVDLITMDDFLSMYRNKTGALMKASILSGYLIAKDNKKGVEYKDVEAFADAFGLAFQLYDDIQDEDKLSAFSLGKDEVVKKFVEYQKIINRYLECDDFIELKKFIKRIFTSQM